MYSMSCDHPDGCSAELETYDGGAWLYDSAAEARTAAYDFDWVTDGEHDYCDRHRDFLADDDRIMPYPPPGEALFPESADPSPVRCTHEGGEWPGLDRCADCGQMLDPAGLSSGGVS